MADFNEQNVPGFNNPGFCAGSDSPQGEYGPFGSGSGAYPTSEGRLGGGGWVDEPMKKGAEHGNGIWAESPAADGEENVASMGADRTGSDVILKTVMGWDESYMASRLFVGAKGE